jgi:phage portal protein BeeE
VTTPLARLAGKGLTIVPASGLVSEPTHDDDGWFYPIGATSYSGDREVIENSFESYVEQIYKANGIIFACIVARMLPFSEARFQYQDLAGGRPGKLFGTAALALLENPWPNGTTGELLSRMEQDASLAGNFYCTTAGTGVGLHLRRMRPDWVTIVSGIKGDTEGSAYDLAAEVLGYIYRPAGRPDKAVFLSTDKVAHYSPIPDPMAQWRGMSWLTPIIREIQADSWATSHKMRFFRRGAALNVVVKYDKSVTPADFERYVALFDQEHEGDRNAYKTLHLGGGADVSVVGANLQQVDFKAVQGAGETRIAAAAGVGAIIARFSEGLGGSALNQGNYAAAKRQFADMTLRPLWRTATASLAKFVSPPGGSRLWYDTRDVEFLKEDRKDAADILSLTASTMRQLVDAGYTPNSVVAAVDTGDLTKLVHSGLYSVQLRPAGDMNVPPVPAP